MWPFESSFPPPLLAARPHPSRLLRPRSPSRRSSPHKMLIIVRTDLHLSGGGLATHVAHAAVAVYQRVCSKAGACARWTQGGQRKHVLKVGSEHELEEVIKRARHLQLAVAAIKAPVRKGQGGWRNEGVAEGEGESSQRTAIGMMGPAHVLRVVASGLKPL